MSVVCGGSESTQLQLVGVGDLFSTDGGSGERMESVSVTGAAQSEKQGKASAEVFAIPSGGLHAHRCGAKCDCAAEMQPVPGPAARAADVPPSPFTLSLSLSSPQAPFRLGEVRSPPGRGSGGLRAAL